MHISGNGIDVIPPALNPSDRSGGVSHELLRKCAVRWLTGTKRCSVVLSELRSLGSETPDAIGWKGGFSYLIECKVSRSDFLADIHKPHHRTASGMGCHRYYMVPDSLLSTEDLTFSHCRGYGLLWVSRQGDVRLKLEPERRETNHLQEIVMLTSALRRVKTREFLTIIQEAVAE